MLFTSTRMRICTFCFFNEQLRYTRSMCAMDPFPARENLLALYEKNRLTCQSMTSSDFVTVQRMHGVRALFDMHRIKLQV